MPVKSSPCTSETKTKILWGREPYKNNISYEEVIINCCFRIVYTCQTGLNFTSKGCKGSEKGVDAKINPVYLDIPLLAAIKLPISEGNTFVVNAGPYVGFGLGGKATVESGGAEVGTKLFKKIDGADEALMNRCAVGLQYGVGFELGYKYLLNLTGQYGFTNMFKKSLTQENNKNLAFMITVGYRF